MTYFQDDVKRLKYVLTSTGHKVFADSFLIIAILFDAFCKIYFVYLYHPLFYDFYPDHIGTHIQTTVIERNDIWSTF